MQNIPWLKVLYCEYFVFPFVWPDIWKDYLQYWDCGTVLLQKKNSASDEVNLGIRTKQKKVTHFWILVVNC